MCRSNCRLKYVITLLLIILEIWFLYHSFQCDVIDQIIVKCWFNINLFYLNDLSRKCSICVIIQTVPLCTTDHVILSYFALYWFVNFIPITFNVSVSFRVDLVTVWLYILVFHVILPLTSRRSKLVGHLLLFLFINLCLCICLMFLETRINILSYQWGVAWRASSDLDIATRVK